MNIRSSINPSPPVLCGLGKAPPRVRDVLVKRDESDPRHMHVEWPPVKGADFYIIRYGIARDRLFNNYQVYNATQYNINSLNAGVSYYLTVDAVNDSGVTKGSHVVEIK
jgi:xylan 1,4-beta-xylosidase